MIFLPPPFAQTLKTARLPNQADTFEIFFSGLSVGESSSSAIMVMHVYAPMDTTVYRLMRRAFNSQVPVFR
jgi:hypothetical protein